MKTIEDCVSTENALREMRDEACAERDRLIQLKAPDASLQAIQNYNDAIQQYDARLALLPQARKYRRELLDKNLDDRRRQDVLAFIAAEPSDLFSLSYNLNVLG